MAGYTISSYRKIGVKITSSSLNPISVTSKGTINTTGSYALYDAIGTSGFGGPIGTTSTGRL